MSATTAQIDALRRDGFVVVPGLFDAEEIRQISAWADELERLPETPGRQMMYFEPTTACPPGTSACATTPTSGRAFRPRV